MNFVQIKCKLPEHCGSGFRYRLSCHLFAGSCRVILCSSLLDLSVAAHIMSSLFVSPEWLKERLESDRSNIRYIYNTIMHNGACMHEHMK